MIRAVSSCPRCLIDVFPVDPQPKTFEKRYKPRDPNSMSTSDYKARYWFQCPRPTCGQTWSVREEEAENHYDFLIKSGLLGARG